MERLDFLPKILLRLVGLSQPEADFIMKEGREKEALRMERLHKKLQEAMTDDATKQSNT